MNVKQRHRWQSPLNTITHHSRHSFCRIVLQHQRPTDGSKGTERRKVQFAGQSIRHHASVGDPDQKSVCAPMVVLLTHVTCDVFNHLLNERNVVDHVLGFVGATPACVPRETRQAKRAPCSLFPLWVDDHGTHATTTGVVVG